MSSLPHTAIACCGLALVLACGSPDGITPPPGAEAASVEIAPASATLMELDSVAVRVTVRDSAGRALPDREVQWESSDYGVAAGPGADGWLRVGQAGTATLRARVSPEGVSGTMDVTVTERPVASVEVTPAMDSIVVGGSSSFAALALDEHGRRLTRTFTWTVSDPSVAAVTDLPFRLIRGIGPGSARVEATAGGVTGAGTVSVLLVHYTALTVGMDHPCGRGSDGGWFCWGSDFVGQMLRAAGGDQWDPRPMRTPLRLDTLVASVKVG